MMKSVSRLVLVLLPVMVAIASPALGQTDLLTGEQAQTELSFGLYIDDATGNQDWIREFDGRKFNVWGLESLNSYGYSGSRQYWFEARDLIVGDESLSIDLSFENRMGVRLSTDALTHRLARIPAINPYLGSIIYTPLGDPDAASPLAGIDDGTPFGDAVIDLTPDTEFAIGRRVNDFGLRHYVGRGQGVALVAGWWQEIESGPQQILFYDSPGTRNRSASALNIDRTTGNGVLGADFRLGRGSVVNYTLESTRFSDATAPATSNTALTDIHYPDVKTASNSVKARSRITDRLYFTGAHTSRTRSNESAVVSSRYEGAGGPIDDRIKVKSTNLALTFVATDTLSLTGKWRKYDLENFIPGLVRPGRTAIEGHALSREVESLQVGAAYTGIKRAFVRLGFERRDTDREEGSVHGGTLAGNEMIRESTKSDIWRLRVRYHPSLKLSFSGNLEKWDTEHPGYFGLPTDSTRVNLNATYLVQDNLALYGDFCRVDDKNEEVRVAGTISTLVDEPDPPLTEEEEAAYEHARELAAGQGYENEFTTTTIGAWYAINPKLTLDANISRVKTDAAALWVIGADPGQLPHLAPDFVPYEADDDVWSVGLTYAVNPKLRVHGRFLNSDSQGRSTFSVIPGADTGEVTLPLGWTPVDVNTKRYTVGFAYQISSKDRLLFDFSVADWKDGIDTDNNGRYNLWRLAWSTRL